MRTEEEIKKVIEEIDNLIRKYGLEIINDHELYVRRSTLVWVLGVKLGDKEMNLWRREWSNM